MSKRAFQKIADGLEEAIAFASGDLDPSTYRVHVPPGLDVKAIRRRQGLSQQAFAERYGFSVGRIRDWEQGRSSPDGPARILLKVIDKEPEAIERALTG